MNKLFALIIASFFVSASVFGAWPFPDRDDGPVIPWIADEAEGARDVPSMDGKYQNGLQCNQTNHRLYVDYSRDGFTNVSDVRAWCNGFMNQFGIHQDRFDDHCGWSRVGTYGRYTYNGNFIYFQDYDGQPRFYFQAFCGD